MRASEFPLAIALMGPTAAGKTQLAIDLALRLNAEIISVDSGMVYRGMDIGTAKPQLQERRGVPHHLVDILDPAETFSTGQFRERALALMDEITRRGRLPLLVGGTMLYFNGLFHGLAELPPADPLLRQQLDEEAARLGWERLHDELRRVDPHAAARIHPNDPQRIQRALEVYRITGVPLTVLCEQTEASRPTFEFIRLIVTPSSREVLRERIRQRFLDMLAQGFVEEVRQLFARSDLNERFPSVRAVGYRQIWAYLKGESDYPQMVERAVIATRQFAKRQYTWLRRERSALTYFSEDDQLLERVRGDIEPLVSP